jgi:hypothetical protein
MGDDPAVEPPPLYSFDPSIGRLAITTPTYNTAIVCVSNGAFPYGGLDLARWFDSRQRVISHIGGRAPAGFGMLVRSPNGTLVTGSQRPRSLGRAGRIPLILNRSPQGPITRVKRYPRSPHAGRFDTIETGGLVDRAGVRFRSRYVFRTADIQVHWQITRTRTDALNAEATLPSWGEATLNAVMRSGEVVKLAGAAFVQLSAVRYFFIDGAEGGYVVVPRTFLPTATAHVIKPSEQSSNPRPGPSISVRMATGAQWRDVSLRIVMAPARTAEEAAAVAARLAV